MKVPFANNHNVSVGAKRKGNFYPIQDDEVGTLSFWRPFTFDVATLNLLLPHLKLFL